MFSIDPAITHRLFFMRLPWRACMPSNNLREKEKILNCSDCVTKLPSFRKLLGIRPELTDGHPKVVADGSHHIAGRVGSTTLYSSQIIGAIAKGFC
jgi:hypothetical protein